MDWVIDTDVLVRAEDGDENHEHCFNVMELLGIIRQSDHYLVVDYDGTIEQQYRENLQPLGWVSKFLKSFVNQAKVRYVSGSLINRITGRLDSLRFDSDDHIFVAVAHGTKGDSVGHLVAEESDYTDTVIEYLSGEGVQVMDCQAALAEARPEQEG